MPTDQAEIVQDDQLELQEHCNADQTAATRKNDVLNVIAMLQATKAEDKPRPLGVTCRLLCPSEA